MLWLKRRVARHAYPELQNLGIQFAVPNPMPTGTLPHVSPACRCSAPFSKVQFARPREKLPCLISISKIDYQNPDAQRPPRHGREPSCEPQLQVQLLQPRHATSDSSMQIFSSHHLSRKRKMICKHEILILAQSEGYCSMLLVSCSGDCVAVTFALLITLSMSHNKDML